MKKNLFSKILILILCLTMLGALAACNKPAGYEGGDTLVVGYSYFSNKFSPFFSKTAYDQDVASMTQVGLLSSDRQGNIIYNGIEGETINYNGTDYKYTGIADCTVTTNTDNSIVYAFKLREDIKFSDGQNLTADDVIFSMYVLSDPSYDGSSTFYAQPIEGMTEFRTGVSSDVYAQYAALADVINAAGQANTDFTAFTQAQQETYWGDALNNAGVKFAQEIIDYVEKEYLKAAYASYFGKYTQQELTGSDSLKVALGMRMWGFGSWTQEYVENAQGTSGKVGEAYKNLYTETAVEEGAAFTSKDGKFYVKAVAATADEDLVYISDTAGGYTVTAFTGVRYSAEYDGGFKDAKDVVYDLTTTFPTAQIYWDNILDAYGYDLSDDGINAETAGSNIDDLVKAEFISIEGPKDPAMGGAAINSISGITKTGAYSLEVKMTEFDATAIYQLGVSVAPLHYYGSDANYDYAQNKFGFTKGDLSSVKAKTTTPMGAGAYVFKKFEQGVVNFERNASYFKGSPKITNILFKETTDADKIAGAVGKTFDITDPSFNSDAAGAIEAANGDGKLTGDVITTNLVDNLGYGYIGINAKNVKVGTDSASPASKNLRKAFATLIACYRETAIGSYYGSLASVINYPISNTSWAAPQPADAGYGIAYSKDVEGNAIYGADDTAAQKYASAKTAAIGFLRAAGYTWSDTENKFTAAPTGAKMEYEIIVPGDGGGDHPSFAVCTFAKEELATIGITLTINDPSDSNVLWNSLEAGTQELWCAAWGATVDPDMYQVYHSSNVVGGGGTESNHYGLVSTALDTMIMNARKSADTTFRKTTYKECLELILDWGVEIPIYQRKNAVIFNTSRVKVSTLTPDITTFWGWMNDIELLEMN